MPQTPKPRFPPCYSNLRRLTIVGWDPATSGPLPKGMRALKSLLLMESAIPDAFTLAAVPEGIQELSLLGYDQITSLDGLERFANLRAPSSRFEPGDRGPFLCYGA